MSQIVKTRVINEEERLQDLNVQANAVKSLIIELQEKKGVLEKQIVEKQIALDNDFKSKMAIIDKLELKESTLTQSITSKTNELQALEQEFSRLDLSLTEKSKVVNDLELKKSELIKENDNLKDFHSKIKLQSNDILSHAQKIKKDIDALMEKNLFEKNRLNIYDKAIQERESKLNHELQTIETKRVQLNEKEVMLAEKEKLLETSLNTIAKNIEETNKLKADAIIKDKTATSKLHNADSLQLEAQRKMDSINLRDQELKNREAENSLKSTELEIKERTLKLKEKKLKLDD